MILNPAWVAYLQRDSLVPPYRVYKICAICQVNSSKTSINVRPLDIIYPGGGGRLRWTTARGEDLSTTYPQLIHSLFYGPSTAYTHTYAHVIHTQLQDFATWQILQISKIPYKKDSRMGSQHLANFQNFHHIREYPRIAKNFNYFQKQ